MSWRDSLLDCSFRGVVFDVVGTRDAYSRALAVAEMPYVDGGVTEDLGARPVRYSLQLVFFGIDYEARLAEALAVINERGPGELIHPVLGTIRKAQVVSCEVSHSAPEPDACTVTVDFVESGEPVAFFSDAGVDQLQATAGQFGDSAFDGIADRLAETVSAIRTAAPFAALTDLRLSMLDPLLGFSAKVSGASYSGLSVLDEPRAWTRDIATISASIIAVASFDAGLMADWYTITGVFDNLAAQYNYGSDQVTSVAGGGTVVSGAVAASGTWLSGVTPTEAQAQGVVQATLAVNHAVAYGDCTARVLAAEAESPTLSPPEIEQIVSATRREIDGAIETARAALPLEQSRAVAEPLRSLALILQDSARAIIEQRPPLVTRTIEAPGNLRLIAHRWYGDHERATELQRLNLPRSPNALQMGDTLRAYSR